MLIDWEADRQRIMNSVKIVVARKAGRCTGKHKKENKRQKGRRLLNYIDIINKSAV